MAKLVLKTKFNLECNEYGDVDISIVADSGNGDNCEVSIGASAEFIERTWNEMDKKGKEWEGVWHSMYDGYIAMGRTADVMTGIDKCRVIMGNPDNDASIFVSFDRLHKLFDNTVKEIQRQRGKRGNKSFHAYGLIEVPY